MKWFLKCILAGITAVAILCIIFHCYVFTPVHTSNPNGNTDYKWPANTRWFKMTEGISAGRFDANGFNNYEVVDNPEILILGSSHMEAVDVNQNETTAYLLEQKLEGDNGVYNMGISHHNLIKVSEYLPASMALYDTPPKFVIIETSTTLISQHSVDALHQGTVEFFSSYDDGLIGKLQRLSFLRLMYHQINRGLLDIFFSVDQSEADATPVTAREETYDAFFAYISEVMKAYSDSSLIFVYHPTGEIQKDGSVVFAPDEGNALFAEKCQEYGFLFVDMSIPFSEMYSASHVLPHGFITGSIGAGHLNADGHEAIASELANLITQIMQEG